MAAFLKAPGTIAKINDQTKESVVVAVVVARLSADRLALEGESRLAFWLGFVGRNCQVSRVVEDARPCDAPLHHLGAEVVRAPKAVEAHDHVLGHKVLEEHDGGQHTDLHALAEERGLRQNTTAL